MIRSRRHWTWHLIHLAMVLLLPTLLVVMTGCKKAQEEPGKLGAEALPSDINNTFNKIQSKADITQLKVGQYLSYTENRRVEQSETTYLMGSTTIQVRDRKDYPDHIEIYLLHDEQARDGNSFDKLQYEDKLVINKNSSSNSPTSTLLTGALQADLQSVGGFADSSSGDSPQNNVSYYGFKVWTGTEAPPDAVTARSDCGGLSPCILNLTYMQYDEVHWKTSTTYDKYHYDFVFTNQLPYMTGLYGLITEACISQYVPIDGHDYYVRDCQELTDFQK